eukprot:gene2997-4254_t
MRWHLRSPSEWIAAANDPTVSREYAQLEYLVEQVDSAFHALLVAQRGLWLTKPPEEVVATAQLATRLSLGCARGRPLRLLAEHGVDTKFFERNASLLTRLLDERFEGAASEQGLTTFLDVGANVDCNAARLVEFAIMGEAYHRAAHGIARPTVGLLNVGSEEMKGHEEV